MSQAPELLARHVSPDGALTLLILRLHEERNADIAMGFEQSNWHFHPTEEEALRIASEVLADRVVIMSWSLDDHTEFELMDDLELEIGSDADGRAYDFRLWSRGVSFEDLVDGRVQYVPLSALWDWRTA